MKTILYFTLTLLVFVPLAFVTNSFAQDASPEYVVRAIYFIPKDREPDPNINEKFDTWIKDAQQFYADQMEAHGFGRKTFRFETDKNGNVVVHHVDGKFQEAYYHQPSIGSNILLEEIEEQFDPLKNIYAIAFDTRIGYISFAGHDETGRAGTLGFATFHDRGGFGVIPASNPEALIHELGHAFGLLHEARADANIISASLITTDAMASSFCAAEWMNVSRYFNSTQEVYNQNTNVQMLKPSLAAPPSDIRFRFEVSDPDGLHQVQLSTGIKTTLGRGSPATIGCKKVSGKNVTVEFVTNDLIATVDFITELDSDFILLRVMDMHGNFSEHFFPIDINGLLPSPEAISIPDPILAAAIRETLRLVPQPCYYANRYVKVKGGLQSAIMR